MNPTPSVQPAGPPWNGPRIRARVIAGVLLGGAVGGAVGLAVVPRLFVIDVGSISGLLTAAAAVAGGRLAAATALTPGPAWSASRAGRWAAAGGLGVAGLFAVLAAVEWLF
jgi:hypothetical protein